MYKNLINAIRKSGNNLHMKVVKILEETGFEVDLNSYYYDDTMEKPREIDIIARRIIDSSDGYQFNNQEKFEVSLFVECKHFKKEIAFRLHNANRDYLEEGILIRPFLLIPEVNTKEKILSKSYIMHHHLGLSLVGKLHDTPKENENELFNAITQPVKSYVFSEYYLNWGISYLVVVYENISGIYEIIKKDLNTEYFNSLEPKQSLTFGIMYSYKQSQSGDIKRNRVFLIDFIHKEKLKDYLGQIVKEVQKLAELIPTVVLARKKGLKI